MVGDGDKIVPAAYADILTSRIPNSKSQVMENAGHMFPHEHPVEFAKIVLDFLSE